jgi:hypothetical protein
MCVLATRSVLLPVFSMLTISSRTRTYERAKTTKGPEGDRLKLEAKGAFDIMYVLRNLVEEKKKKE